MLQGKMKSGRIIIIKTPARVTKRRYAAGLGEGKPRVWRRRCSGQPLRELLAPSARGALSRRRQLVLAPGKRLLRCPVTPVRERFTRGNPWGCQEPAALRGGRGPESLSGRRAGQCRCDLGFQLKRATGVLSLEESTPECQSANRTKFLCCKTRAAR